MSTTSSGPAATEATGLTQRYGRGRPAALALEDCSFRIPAGSVCALAGPNGAGKSTLLRITAGLIRPAAGTVRVLGAAPGTHRDRVGYLDQDQPLYGHLSIADTLAIGARLNAGRWDAAYAAGIVEQGGLDPQRRIRGLSGGQRTRVALALTLGKRPELLLLDEPMADLDPLARRQLMGLLLADAAENGTSILLSSHIVSELTYSCDHLLLLDDGRIRLGGSVEELLAAHTVVTGRGTDLAPHTVIESHPNGRGLTALIRPRGALADTWQTQEPTLEELVLAHLRTPSAPAFLTPDMRPTDMRPTDMGGDTTAAA
ncbi:MULTISPECIES: ABC transporter ATP-binding protein [unclassified Streptomyces]|uniref:ABC transporter ATP-binding protein n=1 Tax=unclassified Streptomyces TaxID=2593676 RepID=UPI002E1D13E2|nr:ABC transporter ATP-binding protein [Streptomyces sp. NBC_01023]